MNKFESKILRLCLVIKDADFIASPSLEERSNTLPSAVPPDVEAQKQWIKAYKRAEQAGNQYYFIIERIDGTPCGTVPVYDLREESFCWGSWIPNQKKADMPSSKPRFWFRSSVLST